MVVARTWAPWTFSPSAQVPEPVQGPGLLQFPRTTRPLTVTFRQGLLTWNPRRGRVNLRIPEPGEKNAKPHPP